MDDADAVQTRRRQSGFDEESFSGQRGDSAVPALRKMEEETKALRNEVAGLKDLLHDHETNKKIGDAVKPLMDKIYALESRKGSQTGTVLSDSQFETQTQRETVELIAETAERNLERILGPLVKGQADLQKYQLVQHVIMQEKMDNVPPGSYLKYLAPSTEEISDARVHDTLKKMRRK